MYQLFPAIIWWRVCSISCVTEIMRVGEEEIKAVEEGGRIFRWRHLLPLWWPLINLLNPKREAAAKKRPKGQKRKEEEIEIIRRRVYTQISIIKQEKGSLSLSLFPLLHISRSIRQATFYVGIYKYQLPTLLAVSLMKNYMQRIPFHLRYSLSALPQMGFSSFFSFFARVIIFKVMIRPWNLKKMVPRSLLIQFVGNGIDKRLSVCRSTCSAY